MRRSQRAVASGRTANSLVVICRDATGALRYKGVRLSLGTGAEIDGVTEAGGVYTARNEVATYTVSPRNLTVAAQGAPVKSEPMLEYRSGSAPAPRPAAVPAAVRPVASPASARPVAPPAAARPGPPPAADSATPAPVELKGSGDDVLTFEPSPPWHLEYSVACPARVPVDGVILATSPSGTDFYVRLHGAANNPTVARGWSLTKYSPGPVTVAISKTSDRCAWTVRVE